jgi:hypothetical protein
LVGGVGKRAELGGEGIGEIGNCIAVVEMRRFGCDRIAAALMVQGGPLL